MKPKFVDCFVLIGTALSLNNDQKLPETGRTVIDEVATTFVNVSVTLEEVHFADVNSMEVIVTLLLHQRWVDSRLGADRLTRKMAVAGQIWRPKITITKGAKESCNTNEDTQFWRGFGDEGNVLLSEKITIKTFCTRHFRRFPFDHQICELKFGTYRFPIEEVELVWGENPVEVLTGVDLNEFALSNVSVFHEVDVRPSGNFSVLVVQILVTRYYLHYVICVIVPCMILVLLTYGSFWINQRKTGVRLTLSLVVLLSLLYFYHVATCLTMKVPFLKSLDLFVILCLTFASFSVFENVCIGYALTGIPVSYADKECESDKSSEIVMWMERLLRIAFLIFYIFCILALLYCTL